MNSQEIQYISQLDPDGMNGTIQSVLMNKDLKEASFTTVLRYLLERTLDEKAALQKLHDSFFKELQRNGLMTNELLGLE
jgi:hypothetical protein